MRSVARKWSAGLKSGLMSTTRPSWYPLIWTGVPFFSEVMLFTFTYTSMVDDGQGIAELDQDEQDDQRRPG